MNELKPLKSTLKQKRMVYSGIIISGLCWYFSNGLSGDFPYLLWMAPIPILIISLKSTRGQTFYLSFIAYLIGRLSWFTYLVMVATLVPAILFTLALPLIFALIMTLTRSIILKSNSWVSVFAFPVLFTAFEFLLFSFSPDGTAASIAYSQSNLIPVIQIASLTGILGITFLVTFLPSAIALSWYFRMQKRKLRIIIAFGALILISTFLFGCLRISNDSPNDRIKVGLVVLDEKLHDVTSHPDFKKEQLLAEKYTLQITLLASQGAEIVVLPERAININQETEKEIIDIFCNVAKQKRISLIIGYTNYRNEKERNSAIVINQEGDVIADYNKVHLVTGLERQFTPGGDIGLFKLNGVQAGTAICKDLDFPDFIKEYGRQKIGILFVPAWDFEVDDWLHSRMAILRSVENGFSQIRAARQGRLTISDCYGRITNESSCSRGRYATLTGDTSLQNLDTVFSRWGNWFGIINLIAALVFIITSLLKKEQEK